MGLEQIDIEHEHKGVKLHVRVTTLLFHTVQYHYHDQLQFTIISVIDALCSWKSCTLNTCGLRQTPWHPTWSDDVFQLTLYSFPFDTKSK